MRQSWPLARRSLKRCMGQCEMRCSECGITEDNCRCLGWRGPSLARLGLIVNHRRVHDELWNCTSQRTAAMMLHLQVRLGIAGRLRELRLLQRATRIMIDRPPTQILDWSGNGVSRPGSLMSFGEGSVVLARTCHLAVAVGGLGSSISSDSQCMFSAT